jgi:hypothetical protein
MIFGSTLGISGVRIQMKILPRTSDKQKTRWRPICWLIRPFGPLNVHNFGCKHASVMIFDHINHHIGRHLSFCLSLALGSISIVILTLEDPNLEPKIVVLFLLNEVYGGFKFTKATILFLKLRRLKRQNPAWYSKYSGSAHKKP